MNNPQNSLSVSKSIDPRELDGANYLHSLLEKGIGNGAITDADFQLILKKQAELLRERIVKYCGEHNSSVPEETAKKLSDGMLFTEGVFLHTLPSPDAALKKLIEAEPAELFWEGLRLTERKLRVALSMTRLLMSSYSPPPNTAYSDTVNKGLPAFFAGYNAEFFGNDRIISADYPPAVPINLAGIEFIEKYTESLIYEQKFLSCFSPEGVEKTLCAFEKSHRTLIFNVCARILAAAFAVLLSGENPIALTVAKGGSEYIGSLFSGKSKEELTEIFRASAERLFAAVGFTNVHAQGYINECIPAAAEVAAFALCYRGAGAFVSERGDGSVPASGVSFSSGAPMPDREYRELLDRLGRTEDDSARAQLILSNVTSLTDIEDILSDCDASDELLLGIFPSLPDAILAVMLSHNSQSYGLPLDEDEAQPRFSKRLYEYISALPKERAEDIIKLSESLSEEEHDSPPD